MNGQKDFPLLLQCERVMYDALTLARRSDDLRARSQKLLEESIAVGREFVDVLRTFVEASSR